MQIPWRRPLDIVRWSSVSRMEPTVMQLKVIFHANVPHMPGLVVPPRLVAPSTFVIKLWLRKHFVTFSISSQNQLAQVALHFMSEYCLTEGHRNLLKY